MNRNIAILRTLESGAHLTNGDLQFRFEAQAEYDSAFLGARDGGILGLMPYEEAAMYSDAYNGIALTQGATVELGRLLIFAKAAARGHEVLQLTPSELQQLLTACSNVREETLRFKFLRSLKIDEWRAALSGKYRTDLHAAS